MSSSMNKEDALLVIKPANDLSREALHITTNERFLVLEDVYSHGEKASGSRESTPATGKVEECLVVHLHTCARDPLDGWVCGSDEDQCDLLLDRDRRHGVSGVAFTIRINHRTQKISITAGRRGLKYKASDSRRKVLVGKGSTLALKAQESYTVYPGLLQFKIRPVTRTEAETQRFNSNFRKYLLHVNPCFAAHLSLGDDDEPEDTTRGTAGTLVLSGRTRRRYRVLDQELGVGGSATVKRACGEDDGKMYAVKLFNHTDEEDEELARQWKAAFRQEVLLLRLLKHDKIVKYIDSDAESTFLIMEAMEGETLIEQFMQARFSNHELEIILHDMLEALQEIHSNGLIHFDIKPDNILVERRDRRKIIVKLADFGLMSSRCDTKLPTGTFPFCAPELFEGNGPYSFAVDLWSLGVALLRLICDLPYPTERRNEGFDPLSVWAYGWRGVIHGALKKMIGSVGMDGLWDWTGYLDVNDNQAEDIVVPTASDLPNAHFVIALATCLQMRPSERGTAHEMLCTLRKAYGVGYFRSLRNEPEDALTFEEGIASPPYEVIPRSPYRFDDEEEPSDLDEYFEIEANKCAHFLMTHDRMHLDLNSIFDTSDCSSQTEDDLRSRVTIDEEVGYISVEDALFVCDKLKILEVYALISDQSYFISRPGADIKPNAENPELDEIPLAQPTSISCLRYLGLVSLDDLLEFAGVQADDCLEYREHYATLPCIHPDCTLIRIEDAIEIARQCGELSFLLCELLVFQHFLSQQPDRPHRDLFDSLRNLNIIIVALESRVLLVQKGSGTIDCRSLDQLERRRRLQRDEFLEAPQWITYEYACAEGRLRGENKAVLRRAVEMAQSEDWGV